MNVRNFKKIEWWIPICAIILCGIGLIALFSASYDSGLDEFKKQIVWMGISIGIMIVTMLIDYKILIKNLMMTQRNKEYHLYILH